MTGMRRSAKGVLCVAVERAEALRPIREIRAGDIVWFAPGEKQWHGASPTTAMAHIAMQEALDGTPVTWMEHVTDEQYDGKVG
jgi:quercetin dioxygenase-like cupin family protein